MVTARFLVPWSAAGGLVDCSRGFVGGFVKHDSVKKACQVLFDIWYSRVQLE